MWYTERAHCVRYFPIVNSECNVYQEAKTSPLLLQYYQWWVTIEELHLPTPCCGAYRRSQRLETHFLSPCIGRHGCAGMCASQLVTGRYCWPAGIRNGCFGSTPGKWILSKPERQKSQTIRFIPCHLIKCLLWLSAIWDVFFFSIFFSNVFN